jgi:antitoxin component YwqK of YwqJK toxin-antitoxin module
MKTGFLIALLVLFMNGYSQAGDTVFNALDANGHRQGYWKIRRMEDNGIAALISFKDDKRNGLCIYYYPDGQIQNATHYTNDTLDGNSKVYRKNGTLMEDANFTRGFRDGVTRYFKLSGRLEYEQEWKMGYETGKRVMYYPNGRKLFETYFIDGLENGVRKIFADTEAPELTRELDFRNGVRVAARYFENGKLLKEEKFNYEAGLKKDKTERGKNASSSGQ